MFTGIVEETGGIRAATGKALSITADKTLKGMEPGGSIAVNGICLTVTDYSSSFFTVDVMPETLRRTNLGTLRQGDAVNLERPLALGGELGGHLVQGHVDDTGRVTAVTEEGNAVILRVAAPPEIMGFTVVKGFIAVDGASLTIAAKDGSSFTVSLVGYTREHTTLGNKKVGDAVNLEVDIIAKYVAQLSQPQRTGITADFLQEHGFVLS